MFGGSQVEQTWPGQVLQAKELEQCPGKQSQGD